MKSIKKVVLILIVIAVGFTAYFSFIRLFDKKNIVLENYPKTLDTIKIIRKNIKNKSSGEKGKEFTNLMVNKIFPYWYGTPWDFNGTTKRPNEGKIACGYFVTTTIQQMGFPINRIKLAQCASEEMIKNLVSKENIFRFSQIPFNTFEKKLLQKEMASILLA